MPLSKLAKACALGVAVVFGAGAAHAANKKVYTLKLSDFVPPQHSFSKWVIKWTQKITKETHGRLKFQIYPNGQLVGPPNRQFDAARNGIVDIAWCLNGVTPGRYPMADLANLPFTWPSGGINLPLMAKRMTELAPKYFASEYPGLHILFMNMANPVVVYSKEPIHSIAGFKGKKIRYASIANRDMLAAMGAVPLLVPPPQTQDALAKGIVEGATFPHEAGLAYHLASVVHYTIEPPMASAVFALVMNKAKYESLPKDLRAILDKEAGVNGAMSFARAWAKQEVFARHLETTKMGLHIIELPPAAVAKEHELAKPIIKKAIAKLEAEGKPAQQFYDAYTK